MNAKIFKDSFLSHIINSSYPGRHLPWHALRGVSLVRPDELLLLLPREGEEDREEDREDTRETGGLLNTPRILTNFNKKY